jgi:HlyD family secretion protein
MRRLLAILPAILLAACGGSDDASFQGYIDADFVNVAPEVGGRIVERPISRGSIVKAGDLLFRLDDTEAKSAVDQSKAEVARAEAQLTNLKQGQRPPEIAVIEAQIVEARASVEKAQRDYDRQLKLFNTKVISQAQLDEARETIRSAEARLMATERQKDVAAMPARTPEIDAGERAVESANASLDQAKTRLTKYVVSAPVAGRIDDTHYEVGEVATIGSPVLSLLPDDALKVIFFVPEPSRTALTLGSTVTLACDGCPENLSAKVTFLGAEAEFTPPVIFSRENSGKLVFRAEAKLSGDAARLPVGQPVTVTPALRGSQ